MRVNCLVGPSGAGFDAAAGNPCGKAGNGAIADCTDAAQKAKLTTIAASAKTGVGSCRPGHARRSRQGHCRRGRCRQVSSDLQK